MDAAQLDRARAARGFMPEDEGLALHDAAAGLDVEGPLLEIGSYCGKSAIYLGTAARAAGRVLYALDHHRGSEENQAGWEHHEPDLVDNDTGKMDTLPIFRRTVYDANLEGTVVALVGDSPTIAANWQTPLAMLFVDGGHGEEPARLDYLNWVPKLKKGGTLAIHDVFADPTDGGRPPYEQIYLPAIQSGHFTEVSGQGSLRLLRRNNR
jgi:predicted O-methyltransferase YrrM